jgi:hypothetical protein
MGRNQIIDRILREAGDPRLAERLERMPAGDLQSLLLAVFKERAAALGPADVLRQYTKSRFVRPTGSARLESLRFETLAFSLLPAGFKPVELSPLCPLGTSSALGPVGQDKVVSTARNTEVLSDPTNAMALECAVRRKARPRRPEPEVKLACSQRLVRAQAFTGPASFAHFGMLALCTAGRDSGCLRFERSAAFEHIAYFLRLLSALEDAGHPIARPRLRLMPFSEPLAELAGGELRDELSRLSPGLEIGVEALAEGTREYYSGLRYQIFASGEDGAEQFLVDGGTTDWTQKLLGDRKERFMTSGMGSERFLVCFARREAARKE